MRWIVRGDIDGFFGLALDNLVQLLLIDSLCRFVLGFPPELVYGRVLPGAAISILLGNLFYAYQAKKLAERTGRTDVCALPYGINTVSLFAHVFLVMLPAKVLAEKAGLPDPARVAWQAGLLATLCSGLMELMGALVAERVRKATPRAALLSTLAGIALGFISLGFFFRTFARPVVGLTTLGIVLLTNRVSPKIGDMIQALDDAFEVPDAVAVRIAKRTRVNLIDNCAAPPIAHGANGGERGVTNQVRQVWGAKPDKRGIALAQMLDESRPWRPVSSLAISIVTARSECAGVAYERFPALRGDALPSDLARYFPVDNRLRPSVARWVNARLA
jgi:hypothetical protein